MLLQFLSQNFNIIGMVGVAMVLIAYFLLQVDKMSQDSITFSASNFMGSILILVSLHYTPNLASEVIEWSWLCISFMGLIKSTWFYCRKKYSVNNS